MLLPATLSLAWTELSQLGRFAQVAVSLLRSRAGLTHREINGCFQALVSFIIAASGLDLLDIPGTKS